MRRGVGGGETVNHDNTQSVSSSTRKQEVLLLLLLLLRLVGPGGEKPHEQMKEGGLRLCCCYRWSSGGGGTAGDGGERQRGTKYLGQAGRDRVRHGAEVDKSGVRAGRGRGLKTWGGAGGLEVGGQGSGGQASHLDRVLSAKCFCWLSACLRKRTTL